MNLSAPAKALKALREGKTRCQIEVPENPWAGEIIAEWFTAQQRGLPNPVEREVLLRAAKAANERGCKIKIYSLTRESLHD